MSRWEFMRQLEELLSDIAPAEREEALQYYNDYFNDAGKENEQEVIQALGSPEQVARIVKDGLFENGQGEFTEAGFVSGNKVQNEVVKHTEATGNSSGNAGNGNNNGATGDYQGSTTEAVKEKLPTWAIVLMVIGGIILSPVILGVVTSVLGTIFSLIVAALAIALGFIVTTIVLFVVAVILVILGIGNVMTSPLAAVGLVGAGCICAAVSILFMVLVVVVIGKGIPALMKGIKYLYHKITDKKEGEQA